MATVSLTDQVGLERAHGVAPAQVGSNQFPCCTSNTNMQDLRHALRLFRKSPGFTAIVIISLALGIGANTAVFNIIYGALLRPLPYRNPDRLIDILDSSTRESELAKIFASYTDFEEFSQHAHTLESVAAY